MRNKESKAGGSKKSAATSKKRESHPFETMSQIQNRYGKGRQKTGSDGSSIEGRGSNH
jgi:hypothetical protein